MNKVYLVTWQNDKKYLELFERLSNYLKVTIHMIKINQFNILYTRYKTSFSFPFLVNNYKEAFRAISSSQLLTINGNKNLTTS